MSEPFASCWPTTTLSSARASASSWKKPATWSCGEAADGDAALAAIRDENPTLPCWIFRCAPHRIQVTRAVRDERLPVGVLVLTAYDDDPYVQAVLEAGANGYVLKNASSEEIVQAVHTVYEGQMALDPAIARKIVSRWMSAGQSPPPAEPQPARARWMSCNSSRVALPTKPSPRSSRSASGPCKDISPVYSPSLASTLAPRPSSARHNWVG